MLFARRAERGGLGGDQAGFHLQVSSDWLAGGRTRSYEELFPAVSADAWREPANGPDALTIGAIPARTGSGRVGQASIRSARLGAGRPEVSSGRAAGDDPSGPGRSPRRVPLARETRPLRRRPFARRPRPIWWSRASSHRAVGSRRPLYTRRARSRGVIARGNLDALVPEELLLARASRISGRAVGHVRCRAAWYGLPGLVRRSAPARARRGLGSSASSSRPAI